MRPRERDGLLLKAKVHLFLFFCTAPFLAEYNNRLESFIEHGNSLANSGVLCFCPYVYERKSRDVKFNMMPLEKVWF